MAEDLVRVRFNGIEKNVGRSFAESHDLNVLDEPTTRGDGTPMPTTRTGGRPRKPKTTVAEKATAKKAAAVAANDTAKEA